MIRRLLPGLLLLVLGAVLLAGAAPPGAERPAGSAAGDARVTALEHVAARERRPGARSKGRRGPRGVRGFKGRVGPRGLTSAPVRGAAGPPGSPGPPGPPGAEAVDVRRQAVSLNWQNGAWQGRERQAFDVPGVGAGEIVCRPDTQWIQITVEPPQHDVTMTLVRRQGNELVVRSAKRERHTGVTFNEGFNRTVGEQRSQGSMEGIISLRPDRDGPGGSGPPPTSVRLAWHWNFDDGSPRCYVAATFITGVT